MKNSFFIVTFLPYILYAGNEQSSQQAKYTEPQQKVQADSSDSSSCEYDESDEIECPVSSSSHHVKKNNPATVKVVLHNNNYFSSKQKTHNRNNASAKSRARATHITLPALGPSYLSKAQPYYTHLHAYWPWYLGATTYTGICYQLIWTNHFMDKKKRWGNWKKQIELSELLTISQKELAKNLLRNIQNQYISRTNPTDGITPLIQFARDIEYEKKILTHYLTLTRWISRFWLKTVFPYNDTKVAHAKRMLERLTIVHHIFISWATEHNSAQFYT